MPVHIDDLLGAVDLFQYLDGIVKVIQDILESFTFPGQLQQFVFLLK